MARALLEGSRFSLFSVSGSPVLNLCHSIISFLGLNNAHMVDFKLNVNIPVQEL